MGFLATLLATLGVSIASALIPIINVEAYLGAVGLATDSAILVLSAVAAVGQMIGKVPFYYLGKGALRWDWLQRKTSSTKAQERIKKLRAHAQERPAATSTALFVSASVGLPPFAIMAVVAGQLHVRFALFLIVGLVGRFLRFAAVLLGVTAIFG